MIARRSTFSVTTQRGFGTTAIACILALYLPIVILVIYAFNASGSLSKWGGNVRPMLSDLSSTNGRMA